MCEFYLDAIKKKVFGALVKKKLGKKELFVECNSRYDLGWHYHMRMNVGK